MIWAKDLFLLELIGAKNIETLLPFCSAEPLPRAFELLKDFVDRNPLLKERNKEFNDSKANLWKMCLTKQWEIGRSSKGQNDTDKIDILMFDLFQWDASHFTGEGGGLEKKNQKENGEEGRGEAYVRGKREEPVLLFSLFFAG